MYAIAHRTVIGQRPPQAPQGWYIFNAPRPLYASQRPDGDYAHWQGDFCAGIFYVAVNPADPECARLVELNRQQHAIELHYVSAEEAYNLGRAQILHRNGDTAQNRAVVDDPQHRGWVLEYYLDLVNHGQETPL